MFNVTDMASQPGGAHLFRNIRPFFSLQTMNMIGTWNGMFKFVQVKYNGSTSKARSKTQGLTWYDGQI